MDAFETYQTSKPGEGSPLLGTTEVDDLSEATRRPSTKSLLVAGASLCAVAIVLGHSSSSSSSASNQHHNPLVDAQLLQMKIDWMTCLQSPDPKTCFDEQWKAKYSWAECLDSDDPTCWIDHKKKTKKDDLSLTKVDEQLLGSQFSLLDKVAKFDWAKCLESVDPHTCFKQEWKKHWPKKSKGKAADPFLEVSLLQMKFNWEKCVASKDPHSCWKEEAKHFWPIGPKHPSDLKFSIIDLGMKMGSYDWMKCLQSSDPACWTEEANKMWPKTPKAPEAVPADLKVSVIDWSVKVGVYDWMKCLQSDDPKCWKDQAKELWPKTPKTESASVDTQMLRGQIKLDGVNLSAAAGGYDWMKCLQSDDPKCWKDQAKGLWSTCLDSDDPKCWKNLWFKGPQMLATEFSRSDMPDWNDKRGRYDWQKCLDSDDPDCWRKEGERVGSFWEDFGKRMKAFWKRIADWFIGKKSEADAVDSQADSNGDDFFAEDNDDDTPLFGRSKKHHHKSKKHHHKSKKTEAPEEETDAPTETPETDAPVDPEETASKEEELIETDVAAPEELDVTNASPVANQPVKLEASTPAAGGSDVAGDEGDGASAEEEVAADDLE